MKNSQNIQISKHYKLLTLLFAFMMLGAIKGNAQTWTNSERDLIELFNKSNSKNNGRKYFNTIVSVSKDEIKVRDVVTHKERTIKLVAAAYTKTPNIYMSNIRVCGTGWGGVNIWQSDVPVIFQPGDTVLVDVNYHRVPGNNTVDPKHKNTLPEDYYENSDELTSYTVRILVPADAVDLYLNRKKPNVQNEQKVR